MKKENNSEPEYSCNPILFNTTDVTLSLEKNKSLIVKEMSSKTEVSSSQWLAFLGKLRAMNNEERVPLNWESKDVKILMHIFAAITTFTMLNYGLYVFTGVKLNYMGFLYSLTWIIVMLMPLTLVILRMFSNESIIQAKIMFLKDTLPNNLNLICFISAFYNTLNKERFLSKDDQALRNAMVISRDILDVDGLKMFEADFEKWLKKQNIGIRLK